MNHIKTICWNKKLSKKWKSFALYVDCKSYTLQLPNMVAKYPSLWKLKISFEYKNGNGVIDYGKLVFWSNPIKMCSLENILRYYHGIAHCSTLVTTVNLSTNLLNRRKECEIGFTKFINATILFYPHDSLKLISHGGHLLYTWISIGNTINQREKFKTRYKLINCVELNYSWTMAADKCKEYGMTTTFKE